MYDGPTLFDLPPVANVTVPAAAVPRVTRQAREILARLRQGRATNSDLNGIAFRYSARIHELRKAGHDIRIVDRNDESGLTVYALVVDGAEV